MAKPLFIIEWLAVLMVFGISQVLISAWRPAVLIEVSHSFHHSFRQMLEYYLKLGHDLFLLYPFQFIIHRIIWWYIARVESIEK
jgi:hypothetical protein